MRRIRRCSVSVWRKRLGEISGTFGSFNCADDGACRLAVFTERQALNYVGQRVKTGSRKPMGPRRPPYEDALEALASIVLAHVPVEDGNFRPKVVYTATMTRRVMMAMANEKMVDDRDYVGNKRLELWVLVSSRFILPLLTCPAFTSQGRSTTLSSL